jgi:hypothetical protein
MIGGGGHSGLAFGEMTGFFHAQAYFRINLAVKTKAKFSNFLPYNHSSTQAIMTIEFFTLDTDPAVAYIGGKVDQTQISQPMT